jgi:hypothetical protein
VAPNDPGLMNRLVEENGFGRVCYEAKDLVSIAQGEEKLSLNINNEERKTMYQRRTQSQRLRSLVGHQIFKEGSVNSDQEGGLNLIMKPNSTVKFQN